MDIKKTMANKKKGLAPILKQKDPLVGTRGRNLLKAQKAPLGILNVRAKGRGHNALKVQKAKGLPRVIRGTWQLSKEDWNSPSPSELKRRGFIDWNK